MKSFFSTKHRRRDASPLSDFTWDVRLLYRESQPKWPSTIFWQNIYRSTTIYEIIRDISLFF